MTKNAPTPTPLPRTRATWPVPLLAGLAHAALMMLAAPPLNIWPAVFIAVLPLAWLVARPSSRPWRDALLVSLGVMPMWAIWEWWTAEVTGAGYVPFLFVQSMWAGILVLCARRLHQNWPRVPLSVLFAALWTAVEFFRGELFLDGYAWGLLPHPLIAVTALASPAALLGTYFVSFLVAMVSGALCELRAAHRRNAALASLLACIAAWTVGALALPRIDAAAPVVNPAIVQTNVRQDNKIAWSADQEIADWKVFQAMTLEAVERAPQTDFIIWPETMVPGLTIEPEAVRQLKDNVFFTAEESGRKIDAAAFAESLNQLQQDAGVPMIVGAIARDGFQVSEDAQRHVHFSQKAKYNSVYLVHHGAVQPARYDKVRLTPFGETMPYIRLWPWLQEQMLRVGANGMSFDLDFGRQLTVFGVPAARLERVVRVVAPVCFEITIANHCRKLVFDHGQRRADLIASITNDGWFSDVDIARLQHLQIARWRCLELATPMARAANTGISALVDARGRIVAKGVQQDQRGCRTAGILTGQVPLGTATTLYARVGDIFPWTALAVSLAALVWSFFRRKTPANAEQKSRP